MRLDARKGDWDWWVYHAEECRTLKNVVWIDDETCEWWEYVTPMRRVGIGLDGRLCRARKIVFLPDRKLVIINPIEDFEPERIDDLILQVLKEAA